MMAEKVNSASSIIAPTTAWTPIITLQTPGSSSFSHGLQIGAYEKLDKLIIANFRLSVSAWSLGSGSGAVFLGGLPFEIAPFGILNGFVSQYTNITLPAGYTQLGLNANPGSSGFTTCNLAASGSAQNGSLALLSTSALGTGFMLSGCVTYLTDV